MLRSRWPRWEAGKDVYLEKPMTHTIEEAKQVAAKVRESGRVLQVGSQTTSSDQWWKARKAIQDGMIGKLISSQGSYHRNSLAGEWNTTPDRGNRNWVIDPDAGPNGKGVNYYRLEDLAGVGARAGFRSPTLFPISQILGLLGRRRDRSFLSRSRPLANLLGARRSFPIV